MSVQDRRPRQAHPGAAAAAAALAGATMGALLVLAALLHLFG